MVIQKTLHVLILVSIILFFVSESVSAQSHVLDADVIKKAAPTVYIDCSSCDMDYIRTEVTFVNYVRDRTEAQIYVLITTQATGSGGTEYTLTFIGQKEFAGIDNVLSYVSNKTDSSTEIREGLVRILKIGLVPYAGKTPIADQITISHQDTAKPTSVKDKWNFWVFSISGRGYFNGEKQNRHSDLSCSFSANRITPEFKFRSSIYASRTSDRFSFTDSDIVSTSKSKSLNVLGVKSISDHWSIGAGISAYTSTYSNIKFAVRPAPAIEYNLFPYSESTRRQLSFLWKPSYNYYRYRSETIYDKTSERLMGETFSVNFELKEKWGSISNSFEVFHYFNDFQKYHMGLFSEISLKLFKGLSFDLYLSFQRIHDQISLAKGKASLEEVLLRRQQLATSYNYFAIIGLSYTFGSIYSNVINPRFNSY
jgi:hypothetical protein